MNIGNPSPQEIYDSYSQIPNTPQGKQQLSQLIQAFKNSGDMRGSIATSILNSYNSQQPPAPPAPQGQVADKVMAQAAPQQMGIAAPGLEGFAPQQGMADGGLVAFAEGGPVRGFLGGGITDTMSDIPDIFQGGMPQVPDAPDISNVIQDYTSAPEPTTRTVGAGESDKPSFDEQVARLEKAYGTPPDIAAELLSKMEHDKLKREKFNTFENIAAGLAGYLGAYGTGAHRAGAGIASMLSTMGAHDKAASEDEATMNALRMKAAMQPYEMHKSLVDQVLAAQTAHEKAQAEMRLKMWEAKYKRESELMSGKQAGEYGLQGREIAADAARYGADTRAAALGAKGYDRSKPTGSAKMSLLTALINSGMDPDEIKEQYPELSGLVDSNETAAQTSTTGSFGSPFTFKTPQGMDFTGWLR